MVQVRKLVVAMAAASALSSGMAHALGLGELSVKSTLNQPLLAEIELTDARGINASQIVPSLGTTADSAQAGVTRQALLSDLTFTPVVNPDGKSVLRVTSSKPVQDPYVKFLVQVLSPNGRAQREYSVLLDPPRHSPEAAAAAAPAQAPAAAPAQLPSVAPPTTVQAPGSNPPAAAPAQPALPPPAADKPAQYVTVNNDTLWEIAEKVRNGGSVQQTMLAIQALNPGAFVGGNINRLKKGEVLRLPTPQQATALPQSQAIAEVARQYQSWREGRRGAAGVRQVDATRRAQAGAAPAQVTTGDNLSLVSAGKSTGRPGAASDNDLANKLAVTQEALDTSRRDNAELKSRLNDLQSQLDKLQRLMELKNDQLAKMQAAGAVGAAGAAGAAPAAPAGTAPLPATAVDASGAPIKPAGEVAPEDALQAGAAQPATPPAEQPLAVEPVPAPEQSDPFKAILSNPVMLGLIGGSTLLVLALLLLFLARRRAAKAEEEKHKRMARALAEESQFVSDMDLNAPADSFGGLDSGSPSYTMAPAAVAAAAANASRERPTDPLVQAEIHIAYGRMNQAVELLEESVKEDPARDDIRLKLMEIYAEQGNNKAFAAHERKLVAAGKHQAEVEQLKDKYPTMIGPARVVEPVVAPAPAPEPVKAAAVAAAPVVETPENKSESVAPVAAAAAAVAATSAAAMAAELDEKYLEQLLADDEPATDEPEAASVEAEQPLAAEAPEDDFDLSLDDFEAPASDEVVTLDNLDDLLLDTESERSEPGLSEPSLSEPALAEPVDLDEVLSEPVSVAVDEPQSLEDFDLGLAEDDPQLNSEDDLLLSLGEDPLDLGASEPPVAEHDLELPEDFDLSLADEIETDSATQAFASEIDDVNAELDRLSQELESPPLEEPSFTAEDAATLDDDLEFDYLSGTDEAATKLDLARAYIDMGDADGARDILGEVVSEGDDAQKSEAREMLARLA
ncbi:FimV/HubP family polar landmark protein [Pseudomonas sp. DTU_2021_1001937_2_SI_NGA_ILE_001]|uniref:FimV/HubP family polar landmark protein n=1 Tax=Pseudomonas sp. DTU_2021_1001937_2_SI_NGA_ILE_001 TaxID=3077589 RepID=UPI0028FC16D1|nr:FimV/HubP family polar landmark protein [Pseudomonas sp. DTU_2021_1001937_2_SI_NGA_ILE_001]WNW14120.1 FimV/HubP family polar landmark protein [Pseudomonas sp. DTU_2021_1001937_2_SI_NGA_ILE_001]